MNIKPYSQKDPSWANIKLGNSDTTIGKSGCYITSIGMILRKIPSIINDILTKNQCFTPQGALDNLKAAQVLNCMYDKVLIDPNKMCIAETDSYASIGYPQHFFVWLNQNGYICDALDGKIKLNKYHIVSYRLWVPRS